MKKLSILILLLILHIAIYAIPAYPKKIGININGEIVYITLKGDENCKFAIEEQGYTILPTEKGWFYADEDKEGNARISDFQLTSIREIPEQTKSFLAKTRKGIVPKMGNTVLRTSHMASGMSHSEKETTAVGKRKVLVILMQFKDRALSKTDNDFKRLFNEPNYHEDGAMGSVYDYYQWASYGQLELESDVIGPYTAQNTMSYYGGNSGVGGNDKNPYALFQEAINYAIQEVNLSDYDSDGDGYVDNVHIIYAGYGEEAGAPSYAIWAHEMTFRSITVQGMKIDRYSCAPELRGNNGNGISRIGPHCHEIGHALGAMDYYDTDYETGGSYPGTGKWDIMASGSWNNDGISPADFNPYVKVYDYGWTEAKQLTKDTVNTIGISSEKGNIYRIDTGTSNDYFLIENRDQKEYHSAEPGKGLLVFHIGPNLEARASTNTINSTYPQQCYIVCASSIHDRPSAMQSSYGDINSAGCPYPGTSRNSEFSDTSTPAALTFSGKKTGISISDITYDGELISFHYGNQSPEDPEDPTPPTEDVYLWGEDFEQLRLPSSWNYTDMKNEGKIEVATKLSATDTPQSPIAASGKGYAKFVAIPLSIIGSYRTAGKLLSPRIKLAEGKNYILAFYVRKYNKRDSHDVFSAILYGAEENSEYELLQCDIDNQNAWQRYSVKIPDGCYDFSIGLLTDIDDGSTLFIDNITISESSEETATIIPSSIAALRRDVYTLTGAKVQQLKPGINIIRMSDGIYKKIFVK